MTSAGRITSTSTSFRFSSTSEERVRPSVIPSPPPEQTRTGPDPNTRWPTNRRQTSYASCTQGPPELTGTATTNRSTEKLRKPWRVTATATRKDPAAYSRYGRSNWPSRTWRKANPMPRWREQRNAETSTRPGAQCFPSPLQQVLTRRRNAVRLTRGDHHPNL